MSDIDVTVGFEGIEQGAAELRQAAGELRELGQAATQAAGGVRTLEQAAEQESAAMRDLKGQTEAAAAAKQRFSQAAGAAAQGAVQVGERWGQVAGALGNVGAVAGTVSPQMAQLGGILGAVGGASGALAGSMGPLGVAIAGVTTAVGLYSIAANRQRERMEAQRRAVQALTTDFRDLASAISSSIERQADLNQIRRGQGSTVDTVARAREIDNRIQLSQRALAGDATALEELRRQGVTGEAVVEDSGFEDLREAARGGAAVLGRLGLDPGGTTGAALERELGPGRGITSGETTAIRGQLSRLRAEQRTMTEALRAVTSREETETRQIRGGTFDPPSSSGGGGESNLRGGAGSLDEAIANAQAEALEAAERGRARQAQAQIEREAEIHAEALKQIEERSAAEAEAAEERERDRVKALEDDRAAHEMRLEAIDKEKQAARAAQEARAEELRTITGEIETQLVRVAALFQSAFEQAVKGEKSFEEAIAEGSILLLKQLGEELVAKGIGAVLEGFTMTVTNPPGAATKIGGGVAMIAFGAGLGAAAAAIPSASAAPVDSPANPREEQGDSTGDDEPRELTLVFNSPIQTAQTNAALSRQLRRQIAADSEFQIAG